jgi:hypothetical protein
MRGWVWYGADWRFGLIILRGLRLIGRELPAGILQDLISFLYFCRDKRKYGTTYKR